ncbi:protein phosphatase 1 regulatory subunit 21-like [Saccostrea echinata]|uniref:protein phosphatase 1 regulatory subunit 21-like n=1 Tax=Saccostrea echinata TaxID=191078 RepID=UPI002A832F00|nr:protein phosphatase 1 regulatory subunit 21-like [Saccostrea echinata]
MLYQEKLKECEQSVRKYEQEVDSLTFRNQQLSTRVLILQEELDEAEANKKKHKHKHDATPVNLPSPSSVYNEELMNKIQENERLHKQRAESNQKYQSRLEELEKLVKDYEKKFSQHQEVLDNTVQMDKAQIDKLQEEKAMLEVKCQTMEKEIKTCRSWTDIAENQLKTVQFHLQRQLEQANKIIADKLPFIDTNISPFNSTWLTMN